MVTLPETADSPTNHQSELDDPLLFLGQAEEFGGIADFPTRRLQGSSILGVYGYPSPSQGPIKR